MINEAKIKFKGCPKCRGDLCLDEDIFGRHMTCLQCGYLRDVDAAGNEIAVKLTTAEIEASKGLKST